MPILESLRGIFSRWGGSGYGSPSYFRPGSRINEAAEAGDLWCNSVVALGIKWLGDRFPRPLIQVSQIGTDGRYNPLGRHDLVDLWQRPNPFYSRRAMEKAVGLSLVADGNAYILKARDGAGRVAELWWLPHFNVEPTWEGDEFIGGYSIKTDRGEPKPLLLEDVIHVRDGIDPLFPRKGISALKAQLREVCAVNEDAVYTASLLKNYGVPGLMVVPNDPMLRPGIDDAKRIKERIKEATTGDNRGETVVFTGNYRIEQVGFSPEQLALEKLTQPAQARLASAVGVALMSIGQPDPGKTYSNLGEANRTSWSTVCSIQDLIGEALRYQLLPEFRTDPKRFVVEYDYSQITEMQESLDALWTRVVAGFEKGLITQNEGRDLIGMDQVPDGDRWFPGTGDPAEIERQTQEDQMYSGAMDNNDAPAPEPSTNGNGNGKAWSDEHRRPFSEKYNHYHDRMGRFARGSSSGGRATGTATILPPRAPVAGGGGGGGGSSSPPAQPSIPAAPAASAPPSRSPADRGKKAEGWDAAGKKPKEVDAHHESMSGNWKNTLSADEKEGLRTYSGEEFVKLNRSLRDPKRSEAAARKPPINHVDNALNRASLKEDTVVYRGIKNPEKLGLHPDKAIGATITDKGFTSTSIDPYRAGLFAGNKGALLKISAPKGSRGASLAGVTRYPRENEVLFARGSGIKVTGVSKNDKGQTVYHAELIQGAA